MAWLVAAAGGPCLRLAGCAVHGKSVKRIPCAIGATWVAVAAGGIACWHNLLRPASAPSLLPGRVCLRVMLLFYAAFA